MTESFSVLPADFRESGVEQSKRTRKQNIFDKKALRHSERSEESISNQRKIVLILRVGYIEKSEVKL